MHQNTSSPLCAPLELHTNCAIRIATGRNVVSLNEIRGLGPLFDAWLQNAQLALNVGPRKGCIAKPSDGSPLRVELHAENMEFGYELVQVAPHAYAACLYGMLRVRSLCAGMHPFYYFVGKKVLQDARVVSCDRVGGTVPPKATWSMRAQHARPFGKFWERQPPYRAHFFDPSLRKRGRRTALVLTKQGILGMQSFAPSGTRNAWSMRGLMGLLGALSAHTDQVYYFRAGSVMACEQTGDTGPDVYNDTSEIRARFPRVNLLQDLVPDARDKASLNAQQLKLAASADVVVATQGGAAVLGSLVAKRLVILCRLGQECYGRPPDVHWWKLLNQATIVTGSDEAQLTRSAVALLTAPSRLRRVASEK